MTTCITSYSATSRLLIGMLVTSLILAGFVITSPGVAQAEWYCNWEYQGRINVNCGVQCGLWGGWLHGCWDNLYYRRCCDAYHCWYTGEAGTTQQCGCPC